MNTLNSALLVFILPLQCISLTLASLARWKLQLPSERLEDRAELSWEGEVLTHDCLASRVNPNHLVMLLYFSVWQTFFLHLCTCVCWCMFVHYWNHLLYTLNCFYFVQTIYSFVRTFFWILSALNHFSLATEFLSCYFNWDQSWFSNSLITYNYCYYHLTLLRLIACTRNPITLIYVVKL